ncbi:MAG TPA: hypothetical protein PLU30_00380 [Verrucomicrobiae bacterium]|nr:hypothetical protein [Verrucomicrobiae bacterium]
MSLILSNSLTEASAIIRGEIPSPHNPSGFEIPRMRVSWLAGFEAAPGHPTLDTDTAWESVVRAWWGLGATWGLAINGTTDGKVAWNLALPAILPAATEIIAAHLTGAKLGTTRDFSDITRRLSRLPVCAAMAGHPAVGKLARLEHAVRCLLGREFQFLILARCVTRPEIEEEIRRLAGEEQFVRDEFLARPGLEQDNHSLARRYLELLRAASGRAATGMHEGGWLTRVLLAASSGDDLQRAQSLLHSAYSKGGGDPEPLRWQPADDRRSLTFVRTAELAALTRPPRSEMPGFLIETRVLQTNDRCSSSEAPQFGVAASILSGVPSIAIGQIIDDAKRTNEWLEIPVSDLCRHMLIAGMTGSGKTVSCEHILLELWREHRIPWLVIEPGLKTGYRRLLNSEIGADIQVWSVGAPGARRLALNPMAVPSGVGLSEHTDALFAIISAAFELVPPMPEVLATAIERTYLGRGWDLADVAPGGDPPRLMDLVDEIDRTTRDLGYGGEITANIRAGLLLRLRRLSDGPLSPELNASARPNPDSLAARPTIIELSALPTADSQAFVMGLIALQFRHHWRLLGQSDSLRHITVIEEAHRLLRAVPETDANASRNRAVEDVANMLAELRAFGAGLAIVDQMPSALVPSAIANTGTKILHRLDHPADREMAGRAAGLPAGSVDLLGTMRPGEAVLRSDRHSRPFRLRVPNPSVTYAKGANPTLAPAETATKPSNCPICGTTGCIARTLGGQSELIDARLLALQGALRAGGEDAAWDWAIEQLRSSSIDGMLPAGPLCFLISLAGAANLSEPTLDRLRTAFGPRTRNSMP